MVVSDSNEHQRSENVKCGARQRATYVLCVLSLIVCVD